MFTLFFGPLTIFCKGSLFGLFNFSKAFLELKYKFGGVTFMFCIDLRILKAVLGIVHRPIMKGRLFLS